MTVEQIAETVYACNNTSKEGVFNKDKSTKSVWLRYIIIHLINDKILNNGLKSKNYGLKLLTDYTGLPQSSVSNAIWRANVLLKKSNDFKELYERCKIELN